MKAGGFLFTLGVGMAAGGMVALMLPRECQARKTAQKAADAMGQSISDMMK